MKQQQSAMPNAKAIKKIFFLLLLLHPGFYLSAQTLSGRVTDTSTHESIPGAVIYIPQLKLGATSDINGYYKIEKLPNGSYDVETKYLGYAVSLKQVTVVGATRLNFALTASSSNIQEVVITALGNQTSALRSPVPVTLVSHDMILQETSNNAIDAIANQPGITEITEGPGISKPEINGLGYNRVLTLFDGERQEDMQWGDEHGIMIDPYAVHDAEIIRGPASLQYGANAVAGVVSFKSEPLAENGTVQGSALSEYQTNNGMIGNSFDVGGNHNGFVWDLRVSNEDAHCYWDPKEGYVWGTAYTQSNVRGLIGWNKKWGYSRLSVSVLHRRVEVPDGNRDSVTGQFEFDYPQNGKIYPTRSNFLSYSPTIAGDQIMEHDAIWWQNSINAGKGKIGIDIGYTQSIRHEIDTGLVGQENMIVHDIPYSFKYQVAGNNSGLKLTTGINGMYEFENNYAEPPAPYIGYSELPNYTDFDMGGYAILGWDYKNLSLSGGLRYDLRAINGQGMYLINYNTPQQQQVSSETAGAYTQYLPFSNRYTGPSGSIGALYQLPRNNYIKFNFAKSYRAPSADELNSNSLNAGASAYIIGSTSLKAEQGYEADVAYGNNGKNISFEVDGYMNYINNFIFQNRLSSKNGGDSTDLGYPVLQYRASTAIISGVSAYFNIHLTTTKWIEFNSGLTYIYSYLPNQTDSTRHVPLTPAPRLTTKVKFKLNDQPHSLLKGTYVSIGLDKYWAQNNIYSAEYTELPSQAYTLCNAGIGTNFVERKTRRTICSFFVNCTNLTNVGYLDHLSHTTYFRAYDAAPVIVTQPNQGIYSMGRNVGLKVVFPIGGRKVSDGEIHGVDRD